MKMKQAWAWLTAGVLALGLNGFYQDGGAARVHQAVDRVRSGLGSKFALVADLATGHLDQLLLRANLAATRGEARSCYVRTGIVRANSRMTGMGRAFSRFEEMSAQREAELARMQAQREQVQAQFADLRMTPVSFSDSDSDSGPACRRVVVHVPAVHVDIPEMHVDVPAVKVNVPQVHVEVPQVHVDVPAVHVSVPPITVHQPAVHVDVPNVDVEVPQNSAPL
jgi:hypothetical protein